MQFVNPAPPALISKLASTNRFQVLKWKVATILQREYNAKDKISATWRLSPTGKSNQPAHRLGGPRTTKCPPHCRQTSHCNPGRTLKHRRLPCHRNHGRWPCRHVKVLGALLAGRQTGHHSAPRHNLEYLNAVIAFVRVLESTNRSGT